VFRSCCHHAFRAGALFRRLAVLGQRVFEFLFDAERVGGGACPEFPERMPIALAPGDEGLGAFPEKGDDAVGELAVIQAARRDAQRDRRGAVPPGCWKFNLGCRKFTDGCACRPFC
jgi:hypothetical protein